MSAAGSSAIRGASRWLAARESPVTATSANSAAAPATDILLMASLLSSWGVGLERPARAGLRGPARRASGFVPVTTERQPPDCDARRRIAAGRLIRPLPEGV